jgi:N-acetylmuramoyl-L-alanine amidase
MSLLLLGSVLGLASGKAVAGTRPAVVVIMLENHSYGASDPGVSGDTTKYVVGNTKDAPYINNTLIPHGRLFTNYHAFRGSLPDYLDVTAGTSRCGAHNTGSTCSYGRTGADPNDNLFHLLGAAGIGFRSYMQSMPGSCQRSIHQPYDPGHNPEVFYSDVATTTNLSYRCSTTDVPQPSSWPTTLPPFSFVVPDACHNMHGTSSGGACQTRSNAVIKACDTWLADNVPALLQRGAIVIVTWDEAATSTQHVPTIMLGPGITGGSRTATSYNHYGLLAGLEHYFGVSPLLANAGSATAVPIPGTTTPRPAPTYTPTPTPAPIPPPTLAPTRLALTRSSSSVTYPAAVSLTATLTSARHAVRGVAVRLEHRTHGSSIWHQVSGTSTERSSSKGLAHWSVRPRTSGAFRAVAAGSPHFAAATSHERRVGLRPAVHLSIPSSSDVLLAAIAKGTVSPNLSGRLQLQRRTHHHWQVVARPRVHHGAFRVKIHPGLPGSETFRVVRPSDGRHQSGASRSVVTHVVAPTLRMGSSGAVVAALQHRLGALHYDIGTRDGSYGWDAEHAVTAFEKVQGMNRDGVAGPAVFTALAHPVRLHLRHAIKHGTAVEVDLAKQVLLISKHGKIWRILDTSTAGGYLFQGSNGQTERAVTPRGHFHVVYKVNALVHARLGTLNRPSFFNFDGYAIHGEGNGNDGGEVPPFPASHGCVRITDNAVNRYYNLLAVGTSVWIY